MTEPNKPLNQMTAQERLDLGMSYFKEGRFDETIKALSSIRREEADPETYAQAQLGLGVAYAESGERKQAIKMLSNIRRSDDPEIYTQAQLGLGLIYRDQDKPDQAIKTWSNIRREEIDPETYTQAQLNLGVAYAESGERKQAIKILSSIRREEVDPETYARAQYNLGNTYHAQGEPEQAIKTWSSIRREEVDPETYARAQLGLGAAYYIQEDWEQAIKALSSIRREEVDPETYAQAQLGLGAAYYAQRKLDQAIKTWSNIRRSDDSKIYAQAQFNLGVAYHAQDEPEQAIKTWSNIRRSDDSKIYAQAQFNIGNTYKDQGNPEQAIVAWSNIRREEADPETYARAQFNIGKIYEDKGDLERAKEAYCNAQDFFYYNYERVKRILECPPKVIKKLRGIAENTDEVLKSLQIIPDFESQVAHYSRASTAFTLLEKKRKDQKPSHFRLSTIRGVNDPTEGLVLGKYWAQQGISETIHTNDTATFISCFTFNHDSLNQFRLYGKENGQEATGVSLVFKKEFFSDQSDTLEFIAAPSIDPPSKLGQDSSKETEKSESNKLIGKSTLYRCIYLDPETGYLTLAQRDKSTFYREHNEDEDTDAKGKWEDYYELISKIEGRVETHLLNKENNEDTDTKEKRGKYHESISTKEEGVETHLLNKENNDDNSVSSILKSIFTEDHLYNKCNKDEKQKILEAIRFILLPLQYLVKHIAFQEEQECRIMYITQFRDKKIHGNREEQKMYVEYEESVLSRIDKIWLSPGAAKYQDFFRILLDKEDNDNKVRISQNPFRNKE